MTEAIGVVGVGVMGLPIALRLRERGHEVWVRDIDTAREHLAAAQGCRVAGTPAALAERCALVLVAVVDGAQMREVLFGALGLAEQARPGLTVMLCPTVAPGDVEAAAAQLAARGCAWIEAPMSGGPQRARAGSMSLMVTADDIAWARWQPLLAHLASRLFHLGQRAGDGARTKLVNNLLAAINLAGAAEALALAGRLGLDAARTLEVIEQSSGQSWIGSDRLRRALVGDARVMARVALLAKDSTLALECAQALRFDAALGAEAARAFECALGEGLADADDSVLWARLAAR